jgi:hypothetical protein
MLEPAKVNLVNGIARIDISKGEEPRQFVVSSSLRATNSTKSIAPYLFIIWMMR